MAFTTLISTSEVTFEVMMTKLALNFVDLVGINIKMTIHKLIEGVPSGAMSSSH